VIARAAELPAAGALALHLDVYGLVLWSLSSILLSVFVFAALLLRYGARGLKVCVPKVVERLLCIRSTELRTNTTNSAETERWHDI
jgi:hypothetical protein